MVSEEEHNKGAEWLSELRDEVGTEHSTERVNEKTKKQSKKMPNCKTSGKDGVQGYWINNLTNLQIANQVDKILMVTIPLTEW